MEWRVAFACSLLLAGPGAGCIELVDAAEGEAAGRAHEAAVAVVSDEERKVRISLIRSNQAGPYAFADGAVAITADGRACHNLRAGGDGFWQVGEDVILTPVTHGCGAAMQSGAPVVIRVLMRETLVFNGTVAVR